MVLTIICAILIFSIIIFVHELGHFVAAKLFKVNVIEFAIGMGPAILKKQGKNTLYSIRAIPMGGFCKMEGEDENTKTEGCFSTKSPLCKIVVLAAGAFMNVFLGFLIMTIVTYASASQAGFMPTTTVESVMEDSSAASFLRSGDKIVGINDTKVNIRQDLSFELSQRGKQECSIKYLRDGETYEGKFTPMEIDVGNGEKAYAVGFNIKMDEISLKNILHESFFQTIWTVKLVFVSLGMLFGGKATMNDISGPVGVVSAMSTVATEGILSFLSLAGLLTVNIGIMNLLPFPALDGGRIVFALYELIRRKPVPPEKEGVVHFIGFAVLIIFMIVVTGNDIYKLIF